ncbi:MAG: hypothetical protein FWF50_04580 [Defluviitaleaceae bacterium]|nr:hypothetical protein [Defluviitaleaceae bacterium]
MKNLNKNLILAIVPLILTSLYLNIFIDDFLRQAILIGGWGNSTSDFILHYVYTILSTVYFIFVAHLLVSYVKNHDSLWKVTLYLAIISLVSQYFYENIYMNVLSINKNWLFVEILFGNNLFTSLFLGATLIGIYKNFENRSKLTFLLISIPLFLSSFLLNFLLFGNYNSNEFFLKAYFSLIITVLYAASKMLNLKNKKNEDSIAVKFLYLAFLALPFLYLASLLGTVKSIFGIMLIFCLYLTHSINKNEKLKILSILTLIFYGLLPLLSYILPLIFQNEFNTGFSIVTSMIINDIISLLITIASIFLICKWELSTLNNKEKTKLKIAPVFYPLYLAFIYFLVIHP